jgi:hypothetical protein
MHVVVAFIALHHVQIVYLGGLTLATLNTIIQVALRLQPLADWVAVAERWPRVAALVRVLGAIGIQPIPVLQALIDLLKGTASRGTLSSAKTLAVSSSAPLFDKTPPKGTP